MSVTSLKQKLQQIQKAKSSAAKFKTGAQVMVIAPHSFFRGALGTYKEHETFDFAGFVWFPDEEIVCLPEPRRATSPENRPVWFYNNELQVMD